MERTMQYPLLIQAEQRLTTYRREHRKAQHQLLKKKNQTNYKSQDDESWTNPSFTARLQTARQLAGDTRQTAGCKIYCNFSFNLGNCLVGNETMNDAKIKIVSITDIIDIQENHIFS
jgi:hypothetical protein